MHNTPNILFHFFLYLFFKSIVSYLGVQNEIMGHVGKELECWYTFNQIKISSISLPYQQQQMPDGASASTNIANNHQEPLDRKISSQDHVLKLWQHEHHLKGSCWR